MQIEIDSGLPRPRRPAPARHRRGRWARLAICLLAVTALAAACGGGGDGDDEAGATTTESPADRAPDTARDDSGDQPVHTEPADSEAEAPVTEVGVDEPDDTGDGTSATVPSVADVPITEGTIPEPSGDVLPEGDILAIVTDVGEPEFVDGEAMIPVTFDVVRMLVSLEAIAAAVAAGDAEDCDGTPCLPNEFYIENSSPQLRTMLVIADADITVLGCDGGCPGQIASDIDALRDLDQPLFRISAFGTGDGARITALHQVYLP